MSSSCGVSVAQKQAPTSFLKRNAKPPIKTYSSSTGLVVPAVLLYIFLTVLHTLPHSARAYTPKTTYIQSGCNRTNVDHIKVNTSRTVYLSAAVVTFDSMFAQVYDKKHLRVRVFGEAINLTHVIPYPGLVVQGRRSHLTNSRGFAEFNGLYAILPRADDYRLQFSMCNGSLVDFVHITIAPGLPAELRWHDTPPTHLLGDTPIRLGFSVRDIAGNKVITNANNVVARVTARDASTTSDLQLSHSDGWLIEGELVLPAVQIFASMNSIVTYRGSVDSMPNLWTPTINARVIACPNRYEVSYPLPVQHATLSSLVSQNVTINGMYPYNQRRYLRCRLGSETYMAHWIDSCRIRCMIDKRGHPTNDLLKISTDTGSTFFDVSYVHMTGHPYGLSLQRMPSAPQLTQRYVTFILSYYVVDHIGNHLLHTYPSPFAPGNNLHGSVLQCKPTTRNLENNPTLLKGNNAFKLRPFVDGVATINMTFFYPDPGHYGLQCNTTLWKYNTNTKAWEPRPIDVRANFTIDESCPDTPRVEGIFGCATQGNPNNAIVYDCPTNGNTTITVRGQGFGRKGAKAFLDTRPCLNTTHDPIYPENILYVNCSGTNEHNNTFRVELFTGSFAASAKPFSVRFQWKPVIHKIEGCGLNFGISTQSCFYNGSSVVTIHGENLGDRDSLVRFYYPAKALSTVPYIQCATVVHVDQFGWQLTCTGFAGTGEDFNVAVFNRFGEFEISKTVFMSFIRKPVIPCPIVAGQYCALNGMCNTDNGTCACFATTATGYWAGADCTSCATDYFGPKCQSACPRADGVTCSQRGTCNSGTTGNGICMCVTGYGGLACEKTCPGGTSSPCSNHGECSRNTTTPTCLCYNSTTNGFWNGTTCDECQSGYVGALCTQKCPSDANGMCGGHGTCSSTSASAMCTCTTSYCGNTCNKTGTECGICPSGRYGTACANFCPAYPSTCSGHGLCGEGVLGSGLCVCNTGYAGTSCEITCQGGASNPCSGHGTCNSATGNCRCVAGYAGTSCAISCPGLATANICSGNGVCSEGASGTGACTCRSGFWGTNCENTCPGGSVTPCNMHGICSTTTGKCACYADNTHGYWTGTACANCATDWWGVYCNATCPKANGVQCGGHGSCSHAVVCSCVGSATTGYWTGSACERCQTGYWGSSCAKECPGGACIPCSGHGTCSDGITGTGNCKCDEGQFIGFWTNEKCSACQPGYYGSLCAVYCPSTSGVVCSGHGTCSEGYRGTGACSCTLSSTLGYWGGAACADCATGYYSTGCLKKCPGIIPCSGHGTCFQGQAGNGTCVCDKTYTGDDCSITCPRHSGLQCSGNGDCITFSNNTVMCDCYSSPGRGYWNGTDCTRCMDGYYGVGCIHSCPRAPNRNNGTVCNGRGTCSDGLSGLGNCTCTKGWAGSHCDIRCQGGIYNPCSGHGTCRAKDGECTCTRDGVDGVWTGRNCSSCHPLWLSAKCTVKCPTHTVNPNVACNGRGTCYDGQCFCQTGYCGDACDKSGFDCSSNCPEGFWGSQCQYQCPGNGNCNNHGYCSEGKNGNGKCTCSNGYWGTGCGDECPGGWSNPCSGHGSCNLVSGVCTCSTGYATKSCAVICPGGASNPCNGRGTCDPLTAKCSCGSGWAGAACQIECPGGHTNPCSGNGICSDKGVCTCYRSALRGYWNGTRCDACFTGYQGPNCLGLCINGRTSSRTCICKRGFSGARCDSACPGMNSLGGGLMCSGHGNCTYGSHLSAGFCTCTADYYTADCSVGCTLAGCALSPYFLKNPACDSATGQCICASSPSRGHFADTTTQCVTCETFYWGIDCKKSCPCRNRGGCEQMTGVCQCFDSDSRGHFAGDTCQRCKEGYVGATCQSTDVTITRNTPATTFVRVQDRTGSFMLVDEANQLMYSGGRPVVVFNSTNNRMLTQYDFGGTVISGRIVNALFILLTLTKLDSYPSAAAQQQVKITRTLGTDGNINVFSSGRIFLVKDATTTTGLSRRLQAYHTYNSLTTVATVDATSSLEESYLVMSTGSVSRTINLSPIEDALYTAYFDQVSCAALTDSLLIEPQRLIIGGTKNNEWSMIAVAMPSLAGDIVVVNRLLAIPECAGGFCRNIAKIIADGTYIISVVHTRTGIALVRFRYIQLDVGARSEFATLIDGEAPDKTFNVTAILVDALSNAGFVAINGLDEATTLYKFDLITLRVYGTVRFTKTGTISEIVTGLFNDIATRTLYASIPMDLQQTVVPLNMYAVTKVFPPVADTQGGTMVTIEGEGFLNENVLCDFNGDVTPAQFISSRELRCFATSGGDERCSGVPLEVSIGKDRFSRNLIPLRRVSSPRITRVYTESFFDPTETEMDAYGELAGGRKIVLEGYGFQSSEMLGCRIKTDGYDDSQYAWLSDREYVYYGGKQGTFYGNARYINSTRIECVQPSFPAPTGEVARVEVTMDGTVFSRALHKYEVVGPARGLLPLQYSNTLGQWTRNFELTINTENVTYVPDVHIWVVDVIGHRLRKLDKVQRPVTLRLAQYTNVLNLSSSVWNDCDRVPEVPPTPILYNNRASTQYTSDGLVTFSGLYFIRPPSGTYTIEFTETETEWKVNFTFVVSYGVPTRLVICREPPELIDNNRPVILPPLLYMVDISGNQLPGSVLARYVVIASFIQEQTYTKALDGSTGLRARLGVPTEMERNIVYGERFGSIQEDFLKFENIELYGAYGSKYNIDFYTLQTVAGVTSLAPISNATSRAMTVAPCPDLSNKSTADNDVLMYFSKIGSSECFPCPEHGQCDGTDDVKIRDDNWWRPNNHSYLLYSCAEPHSGDSCRAPDGACVEGYTGPRCSVCAPGYGSRDRKCSKCVTKEEMSMLLIAVLVIGLGACSLVIFVSLNTSSKDHTALVMKHLINYLQVSARVGDIELPVPDLLSRVFQWQKTLSEFARLDLASIQCEPLRWTYYDAFYFMMCIPLILMFFFAIVFLFVRFYTMIRNYIRARNRKKMPQPASPVVNPLAKFRGRVRGLMITRNQLEEVQKNPEGTDEQVDKASIRTVRQYYIASTIIIMFIVFPSILQGCAYMLKCETIVYGDGETFTEVEYLVQDRSIRCTDSSHERNAIAAIVLSIVYGLGTPLMAYFAIHHQWRTFGWRATRRLFMFHIAGYAKELWWWESVVLLRKAVIVFAVVFVKSIVLQTYIAMWSMSFFLALHVIMQPFDSSHKMYFFLEGLNIGLIALTLNLILLYQQPAFQEGSGEPEYAILTYLLAGLHIAMMTLLCGLFLFHLLKKLWRSGVSVADKVKAMAQRRGADDDEDDRTPTGLSGIMANAASRRASALRPDLTPSPVAPAAEEGSVDKSVDTEHSSGDDNPSDPVAEEERQAQEQITRLLEDIDGLETDGHGLDEDEVGIDDDIINMEAHLPGLAGQIAREEALSGALEEQLHEVDDEEDVEVEEEEEEGLDQDNGDEVNDTHEMSAPPEETSGAAFERRVMEGMDENEN